LPPALSARERKLRWGTRWPGGRRRSGSGERGATRGERRVQVPRGREGDAVGGYYSPCLCTYVSGCHPGDVACTA
jgi:hypothetical protein